MFADAFSRLTLFQDLSPLQRDLIHPLFVPSFASAGMRLFEQGDIAEFLYVILDGEVIIRYKPEDGPSLILARVKPDGVVGWSAVLGNPVYTSSAVCTTDCQLLRVNGHDLRLLCETHPETGTMVLERLTKVIAERLRSTPPHIMEILEQGLRVDEIKHVNAV